ncbi:DNA repair protein RadA [Citricoccus sp. SGAir0253]|uniref:DNA repair protein RadA n=1 Tax=Citricoccus sp. SGAir0253 TaxID=2567881 RepID=UPI0010CD6720|nr:DNA repair protein RadA [Citricoccus sp. SGAir0253]QCU76865.1 DNA repair protein RadA [Citricoccus sp. SGAir0253]
MATKTAKRANPGYRCSECGWTTAKWVGRCGECQAWGTVVETGADATAGRTPAATVAVPAVPIGDVDASQARFHTTGVSELDRVLGGGLVPGAVVLMAGEPGIGKSTLLLDVAAKVARHRRPEGATRTVLYVTGEESAAQVRLRADRIGAVADTLFLAAETDLGRVLGQIEKADPDLLVVDSVQTLQSQSVEGTAGGVTQVREVAASLITEAKNRNMTTVLVGHVTKDGSIAGPRLLEHLVDVVCQFEGERHSRLRLVRAVKNRFGPTDEVGCFDLGDSGILSLEDPSGLFLSGTKTAVEGTCVTVTLEGRRPLVAEVQSLLTPSGQGAARRTVSGLDSARITMILAILQRRAGFPLTDDDCYVATVGGVRLTEPASDLAAALAIASAKVKAPVPSGMIAFGELGLAGEVRPVPGIGRRIREAARLGFRRAVVPVSPEPLGELPENVTVSEVATLEEALKTMRHWVGG